MQLDFLQKKLDDRARDGSLRTIIPPGNLIDFVSNDYLGLSNHPLLKQRIKARIDLENPALGGTGSRLLSGNHIYYQQTELLLASLFKAERALVFNSGYAANQALVSAVADKGDTILYDQLAHVCLKEGAWLSRAETQAFRHNDMDDLKQRIQRAQGRVFVLTETIFSMDGDLAPIQEIIHICNSYNAYLIVDEAHSTGVMGKGGSGYLCEKGLEDQVFARVYTFGKAMGVHGACVAGSKTLIDYLVNFGRPFIYTTSLPPHSLIGIEESFQFMAAHPEVQSELGKRIAWFKKGFVKSISDTAIQPVMVGSNSGASQLSKAFQEAGMDVRAIRSPTVQRGTERLRISLHAHNTEQEIDLLVNQLNQSVR